MTTTQPKINPRLGAAALRAPAASREDSRPQAILKLQPRNSFDYRVRYEPQLNCLPGYTTESKPNRPLAVFQGQFEVQ